MSRFKFIGVEQKIPARYVVTGDQERGETMVGLATEYLYEAIEHMGFRKLDVYSPSDIVLPDGSTIGIDIAFGVCNMTIHVPTVSGEEFRQQEECFCYCKVAIGTIVKAPSESSTLVNGVFVRNESWVPQADDLYSVEVCSQTEYILYENIKRTDFYPHYNGDTVLLLAQDLPSVDPETDVVFSDIPECIWGLWRISSICCPEAPMEKPLDICLHDPPLRRCKTELATCYLCCYKATIKTINCFPGSGKVAVEWFPGTPAEVLDVTEITEAAYYCGLYFTNKTDEEPYVSGFRNNPWMAFAPGDVVLVVLDMSSGSLTLVAHSDNTDDNNPMVMDGGGTEAFLPVSGSLSYTRDGSAYCALVVRNGFLRKVIYGNDYLADEYGAPHYAKADTSYGLWSGNTLLDYDNGLLHQAYVLFDQHRSSTRFYFSVIGGSFFPRYWGKGDDKQVGHGLNVLLDDVDSVVWVDEVESHNPPYYRYSCGMANLGVQYNSADQCFHILSTKVTGGFGAPPRVRCDGGYTYSIVGSSRTLPVDTLFHCIKIYPVFDGEIPEKILRWESSVVSFVPVLETVGREYGLMRAMGAGTIITNERETSGNLLLATNSRKNFIYKSSNHWSQSGAYGETGDNELTNSGSYVVTEAGLPDIVIQAVSSVYTSTSRWNSTDGYNADYTDTRNQIYWLCIDLNNNFFAYIITSWTTSADDEIRKWDSAGGFGYYRSEGVIKTNTLYVVCGGVKTTIESVQVTQDVTYLESPTQYYWVDFGKLFPRFYPLWCENDDDYPYDETFTYFQRPLMLKHSADAPTHFTQRSLLFTGDEEADNTIDAKFPDVKSQLIVSTDGRIMRIQLPSVSDPLNKSTQHDLIFVDGILKTTTFDPDTFEHLSI